MNKTLNRAKSLKGEITVPGDKSISHRAVMLGAISEGTTEIFGFLDAADPLSTLSCFKMLGINYQYDGNRLLVHGEGLYGLKKPQQTLDAGNSGTTLRLITGILAGQKFQTSITGDQYLVKRPMKRIIDPLTLMGAKISASEGMTAPITIHAVNTLNPITYELAIASAQIKSAVLLAGLYANGTTSVVEQKPSRDHTERMLGLIPKKENGKTVISVEGGTKIFAKPFVIPGDPSSAAFFVVAALITENSQILIKNVGLNPSRTGYLQILKDWGGKISVENGRTIGGEPIGDIIVSSSNLKINQVVSGEIIPNIIDEIPILSAAATHAEGKFELHEARDLRNKESDRIHAMCSNIKKMGINVEEYEDGFAFEANGTLVSNDFDSFDDHRIAMALGIASLSLNGTSTIRDAECVSISFPSFWDTLASLQK